MEFGKVTALFGPNNSGKTSLIKLLLMLKQTVESRDRTLLNFGGDPQDLVNLGDYAETVYLHDTKNDLAVEVSWLPTDAQNATITQHQIRSGWQFTDGLVEQTSISQINQLKNKKSESVDVFFNQNQASSIDVLIKSGNQNRQIDLKTKKQNLYSTLLFQRHFYQFPIIDSDTFEGISEFVNTIETSFKNLWGRIHYLGPLRAQPKREYRWSGELARTFGVSGEYTVEVLLNENRRSKQDNLALSTINNWLSRLGIASKLNLQRISDISSLYEVRIHTNDDRNHANLVDVGFGVSQVLPIVALAYLAPPESIIILEQPELHLHPKVQAELADLFLEAAQTRNIQFIIESHSEHLLARLQRRLAERSGVNAHLTENDVKLYFCQREGSESTLQPLQLDQYGRIQNWPPDFFGDLLNERLTAMEAMALRQQNAQTNGQAAQ